MAEWSLKIQQDGWIELTIGPKPRRTIGFPPEEGRAFANALLRTSGLAEDIQAELRRRSRSEEKEPDA